MWRKEQLYTAGRCLIEDVNDYWNYETEDAEVVRWSYWVTSHRRKRRHTHDYIPKGTYSGYYRDDE